MFPSVQLSGGRFAFQPTAALEGKPSHYPIPEAETRSRLRFPALVLENQAIRSSSCSRELTSRCDKSELFIQALAL